VRFAVGGYGSAIGLAELSEAGFGMPVRAAGTSRPSWLLTSRDGRFLYAALESADGHIAAWAVTPDLPWRPLGARPTAGADPCHLALAPGGRWLLAASYTSGSVSVHAVADDGSLGVATNLVQHEGDAGPRTDRQDGAHAHQVVFAPDGSVLVCDLGLDLVIGYAFDPPTGRLTERARSPFPPGTGPRHLALTADGRTAYVLGELASTLSVCRVDGPRLEVLSASDARGSRSQAANTAAAVVLSSDERTVVVSHRGDDTVATFAVDRRYAQLVAVDPCGGRWPRWIGFGPSEETLLVANERSDEVVRLRRRGAHWVPAGSMTWSSPTCVAALG
jgi:6-phosphogluconolactonase